VYCYILVSPTVQKTVESPQSVLEENSVTLSFQILNANPLVTTEQIQWYFNGSVPLSSNDLFGTVLRFSNNYWTLKICNVSYDIQGRFSMVASNVAGSDSDYIDVIVEGNSNSFLHNILS